MPALGSEAMVLQIGRNADGTRLVRVEATNRVVVVDVASGAKVAEARAWSSDASVTGPARDEVDDVPIVATAVAPDGGSVATIDLDLGLRTTDLASGARLWSAKLPDVASPIVAYGAVVLVGQDRRYGGRVTRFDARTGQQLEPVTDFERPVTALAADAARDRFVVGTIDGAVHVIDGGVEVNVIRAHHAAVRDVALVGGELVSGGADGVRVWDPERPQARVEASGYQLDFARDGSWVDGAGAVHERWTGALRGAPPALGLEGMADRVLLAGARDEATLLVSDGVAMLAGRRAAGAGPTDLGAVDAIAVSADGARLGLVADGVLRTLEVSSRKVVAEARLWSGGAPWWTVLAARGDGWLALSGADGAVVARDGRGAVLWSVAVKAGPSAPVREGIVAASVDGELLAVVDGTRVMLLRAADGALVRDLEGPLSAPSALAFTADGTRLAVADDMRLGIWDVARGRQVFELGLEDRAVGVVTSPDGRSIGVALEDGRVCIFNAAWPRSAE
ncbi:MAG: WD40 repeat domain-containing protein [Myxococcota bacterium]